MNLSPGSGRAGEAPPITVALSKILIVAALAAGALVALPAAANAGVFCVPDFHGQCVDDGIAIAEPSLATALADAAADPFQDSIYLAPGTYVSPTGWEIGGNTSIRIYGSGRGETVLTSSGTGDHIVVNAHLNGYRYIVIQDLDIAIPASFPDSPDQGAGFQPGQDTHLWNVDIINYNEVATAAIKEWQGSARYTNGHVRSESSAGIGPIIMGAGTHYAGIHNVTIDDAAGHAIVLDGPLSNVTVDKVTINKPGLSALWVMRGNARLSNAVIPYEGSMVPLLAFVTSSSNASLIAEHVTVVKTGGAADAAGAAHVTGGQSGNASLTFRNSILRGFNLAFLREAPVGPALGNADATMSGSNGPALFQEDGDGTATITSSINVDPQFVSANDYRLTPGSPSIDATSAEMVAWDDRDGVMRPQDGDGNGVPRADQGAYERDMPPPTIKITSGPGKKVKNVKKGKKGVAVFKFKPSETQGHIQCRVNAPGVKWQVCKSGVKFKLKPRKKKYKFHLRMWNVVGKKATKSPVKTFKVTKAKKKK